MKVSQFTFGSDEGGEYVLYTENGSKNRSGTYKDNAGQNKVVKHYSNEALGKKCYIFVLWFYLKKLPPKIVKDSSSTFYWKPKDVTPMCDEVPWFTLQVLGRNTLGSMVKKMFEQIGVEGKTNHSLRATGATRLFKAKVPEKLIKERTGHRSVDSLRLYEHTSVMQQKSVSAVICSPLEQQFENKPPSSIATAPTVAGGVQNMLQGCQNCTFNVCFNQK